MWMRTLGKAMAVLSVLGVACVFSDVAIAEQKLAKLNVPDVKQPKPKGFRAWPNGELTGEQLRKLFTNRAERGRVKARSLLVPGEVGDSYRIVYFRGGQAKVYVAGKRDTQRTGWFVAGGKLCLTGPTATFNRLCRRIEKTGENRFASILDGGGDVASVFVINRK